MADARQILDAAGIDRSLTRIAHEVLEQNTSPAPLVILGIPTRGVPLAERLAGKLGAIEGRAIPHGSLDTTLYRDDLRMRPARSLETTDVPADVEGAVVVLVDDVLYSGRTIRAALTALEDVGRPQAVRLAALVDRGHRELPIRADHVGKNIPTSSRETVRVHVVEVDGEDAVYIATPHSGDHGSGDHRSDSDESGHEGSVA
jgi:pyrimidine operon attenuation protein/uracil phosphoribosyltransferase